MLRSTDGHDPEALLHWMRSRLLEAWGEHIERIILYGSRAKGEARPESDVDVVVDLESDRNLLDLGGLQMDLRELLDRPVDVATESSLPEGLRERILREAVSL